MGRRQERTSIMLLLLLTKTPRGEGKGRSQERKPIMLLLLLTTDY
jgi:hypothetical protein